MPYTKSQLSRFKVLASPRLAIDAGIGRAGVAQVTLLEDPVGRTLQYAHALQRVRAIRGDGAAEPWEVVLQD